MDTTLILLTFGGLLVLVFAGINVAVALGLAGVAAIYFSTSSIGVTAGFIGNTAYEALREYVFAVIPAFLLMGEFIARSGIARDMFTIVDRGLRRLPGRLAYATVAGNVIFAFLTGTSAASATAFTRIAYPQMKRFGYSDTFSLGLISGSACIGMLIPPSILIILWGILTEQSIGKLFMAGIGPGVLLAALIAVYIFLVSIFFRSSLGQDRAGVTSGSADGDELTFSNAVLSFVGFFTIVGVTLGGIWLGWFTPTEGAGVGVVLSVVFALIKGMRLKEFYETVINVGGYTAPLMILIFAAQIYSRSLSFSGLGNMIENIMLGTNMPGWAVMLLIIGIWLVLGMIMDSISIMLLTVPIFFPVAMALGYDPIVFAMVGVLVIEAGLLTPPFGIIPFTVKAAVNDNNVSLGQIFLGSLPFCTLLLIMVGMLFLFPPIVTYLPTLR